MPVIEAHKELEPMTEDNTSAGNNDAAWLGRLITKLENSVDKLGDRIGGVERALSQDMIGMREGFRAEVHKARGEMQAIAAQLEDRIDDLEKANTQLQVTNKILQVIGGALLVGVLALAVTRIYNPPAHVPGAPIVEQRR